MNLFEFAFIIGMLPVIFFAIVVPAFKLGLWISIDVIGKGSDTTWYGFMIYMIIAFWGVGLALAACTGWVYLWIAKS